VEKAMVHDLTTKTKAHLDLAAFAGEWVAVENNEVIEHARKLADVVRRARGRGIQEPYVFFVEQADVDVVDMGL
jgi:hypothetical protein